MGIKRSQLLGSVLILAGIITMSSLNVVGQRLEPVDYTISFRGEEPVGDLDPMIKDMLEVVDTSDDKFIIVEGHVASSGDDGFDTLFSKQLAETVARELYAKRIPTNRVRVVPKGSSEPLTCDDDNPRVCGSIQTRVEVTIIENS